MNTLGRWLTSGLVVLGSLVLPSPVGAGSACAAEGDRAALVVDTGGSVYTFCVSLPDGETSGLGLIVLANQQHGLSYKFGFGGEAVCMLAGVGPTSDDCFEQYPNFWGYWRGDRSGGWTWSGTGAGSTRVTDGDVEGWSWGSGSNGDSHPRPPATSFGDVCAEEAEEPPEAKPRPPRGDDPPPSAPGRSDVRRRPRPAPGPTAAVLGHRPLGNASAGDRRNDAKKPSAGSKKNSARRPNDRATLAPASPSPTQLAERATSALGSPEPTGPPVMGLAALAVSALLGGAGFAIARRRSASGER